MNEKDCRIGMIVGATFRGILKADENGDIKDDYIVDEAINSD